MDARVILEGSGHRFSMAKLPLLSKQREVLFPQIFWIFAVVWAGGGGLC